MLRGIPPPSRERHAHAPLGNKSNHSGTFLSWFKATTAAARERPCFTHLSARVPLDGLLDLAVGAPSQRLQELVAVLQVVLVVVLLHAGGPPSRCLLGRAWGQHGRIWQGRGGVTPRRFARGGMALLGPGTSCPPVGR